MNLKKGDQGELVKLWQRFVGVPADGRFGDDTERATRMFQAIHNLREDGIVGPGTLAAAKEKGFTGELPAAEAQPAAFDWKWRLSKKGEDFIKGFEELRLVGYDDGYGYLTIAWGHLVQPGEPYRLGQRITLEEAQRLWEKDIEKYERQVNHLVRVPLKQGQYDALVSLCFNIGRGGFAKSTCLKLLNAGNYAAAAEQILVHNRSNGKVSKGLVRRRAAERAMFLEKGS